MRRPLAVLLLAVLAVGMGACGWGDPHDLGRMWFNDRKIDFYYLGAHIKSPAHFTWSDQGLAVNGIDAADALPPDTSGAAARLSALYRGTPLVDSLVAAGSDWTSAVNALGCEVPRLMRRAVLDERTRANAEDRALDVLAIRRVITTATALPLDSVLAYQGWIYCSVKGGGRFTVSLAWSDADLTRDPCAEPAKPVTREDCEATIKRLRPWLVARYASLVILEADGMQTFSGAQARRGKAEIALLKSDYAEGGAAAVRARLESGKALVSARSAMAIAQRAAQGQR